jgi:cell division protein FtsL
MAKLNAILLLLAIACALGTVTSQHHARKLFVALEGEHEHAKRLEIEFGQLQLEVSTWGMQARVEKIAASQLSMRALAPNRVQVLAAQVPGETK